MQRAVIRSPHIAALRLRAAFIDPWLDILDAHWKALRAERCMRTPERVKRRKKAAAADASRCAQAADDEDAAGSNESPRIREVLCKCAHCVSCVE